MHATAFEAVQAHLDKEGALRYTSIGQGRKWPESEPHCLRQVRLGVSRAQPGCCALVRLGEYPVVPGIRSMVVNDHPNHLARQY